MCGFTVFPALVHVYRAGVWTPCREVERRGEQKESEAVEKGGVGKEERKRKQTKEEGMTRGDEKTKQACGRQTSSI